LLIHQQRVTINKKNPTKFFRKEKNKRIEKDKTGFIYLFSVFVGIDSCFSVSVFVFFN